MKKNILIVASGTGGHVIPAKNISEKLAQRGYSVTWIGTKSGIENLILKDESYKIIYINSTGIRGKRIWEIIKGLTNTVRSIFYSLLIIQREKPIFVLGFGGYITVPVSIAAFIMRVPIYVHESNSVPGTANKINKMLSRLTFETFPNTFTTRERVITSGNPINDSFSEITTPDSNYCKRKEILNILVIGGSQGARFFNNTIPQCIHFRSPGSKFKIKHISGKDNSQSVKENYGNNFCQAEVIEFSNNMDTLYNWSDIIISRAGSMTISEISKSGRTAILVPFLYATDNHQYRNAKYLVDNNAAIIIKEDSTFAEKLTETLSELYNNQDWLAELAMNSKNLFPEDSSAIILGKIPELNEEFDYTTPKK